MNRFPQRFPTPETAMIDALRRLIIFKESFVVLRKYGVPASFCVVSQKEWKKRSFQQSDYECEYVVYPNGRWYQIN